MKAKKKGDIISKDSIVQIRVCDKCAGFGVVSERVSAYDSENVTCGNCKGSGLVHVQITTCVSYYSV